MNVIEMKVWLDQFPDHAEVEGWDPDEEKFLPITGGVIHTEDQFVFGRSFLKLYTDSD